MPSDDNRRGLRIRIALTAVTGLISGTAHALVGWLLDYWTTAP